MDYTDTECQGSSTWKWVLWSLDLNAGGKDDWLGIPAEEDTLLKCYCSDKLTEEIDFTDDVDISDWSTSDGKKVNLKYMSNAYTFAIGIFLFLGSFAWML